MVFYAYSNEPKDFRVSREREGPNKEVVETIHSPDPPVAESADLSEIEEMAYAHLGREPGRTIYITDEENRVVRFLWNRKHRKEIDRMRGYLCTVSVVLFFCFGAFVATVLLGRSWEGIVTFLGAAAVYSAQIHLFGEGEFDAAWTVLVLLVILVLVAT